MKIATLKEEKINSLLAKLDHVMVIFVQLLFLYRVQQKIISVAINV